jgi:hypothetical protein
MTEERVLVGADTQESDIKVMDIVNVFKKNRPFLNRSPSSGQ